MLSLQQPEGQHFAPGKLGKQRVFSVIGEVLLEISAELLQQRMGGITAEHPD